MVIECLYFLAPSHTGSSSDQQNSQIQQLSNNISAEAFLQQQHNIYELLQQQQQQQQQQNSASSSVEGGAAATVQQLSTAELASLENVVAAQQGVVGGDGNLVATAISAGANSIAGATFSYQPDGTLTVAGGGGQVCWV